ncbi:molybdenum cofactor guanylyltransferase MobA [Pseudahrensia aquimaris]|uniref:Molybdenum cofactor guanylyltransferase n=1 Tax=Pseudahrensia aquimaris TaxID=744461 RepID=A0ABW3FJ78_9HYPH
MSYAVEGVGGIILAGGQGRRMGGADKAMLSLNDRPLLAHAWERLAPQVSKIALNANGDATRFSAFELPVIPDDEQDFAGPLAGVLTGMNWGSAHGFSHILTVASDTPFFPLNLRERLCAALRTEYSIVMAKSGGRIHPVFALWPVHLAMSLEQYLRIENKRKILTFAERYNLLEVVFDGEDEDPFFNINTPEDLHAAQRRIGGSHD